MTESIADRALTTPEILAQEERLLAWAERRMTRDGIDSADAIDGARVELTGPQAETAAAVAGDSDLVLVVGPAGTGKTTALTPAVEQLHDEGRPTFGVAPSAAAADVLASGTGIDADTIDKLLTEHSLDRPPQHRYDLPVGTTVVVDEAGMVGTGRLEALASLADRRGWRVALVGDPMQFAAVGRGGMFEHLIDTHSAIELDQVHRFSNDWERQASLRLRRSDPTVADVYDLEGRLHGGTATRMEREALDAWWTARHNGETVVLAAPTNETVARLNIAAQQRRIEAGAIDTRGRHVDAAGYRFWVGDEIATRRNHRQLQTDQGLMVRNRDQWTIQQVHRSGDLTVAGRPEDGLSRSKQLKAELKQRKAEAKPTLDRIKYLRRGPSVKDGGSIKARAKAGLPTDELEAELAELEAVAQNLHEAIARIEGELSPYTILERERKDLRKTRKELASRTAAVLRQREAEATGHMELVLEELRASLNDLVSDALAERSRSLATKHRRWIEKYGTTLRELEVSRAEAAARLDKHLQELGYG